MRESVRVCGGVSESGMERERERGKQGRRDGEKEGGRGGEGRDGKMMPMCARLCVRVCVLMYVHRIVGA